MEKSVRSILQSAFILLTLGIIVQVHAQPVVVKEIPGNSSHFVSSGSLVYFLAGDALWRTDGTASGTMSLKNGFTQFSSGKTLNGIFYFFNANRRELWRSDGTSSGTVLLKSSQDDIILLGSLDDYLFFSASDATIGAEPYRTNGSPGGTQLVHDINPGSAGSYPTDGASVGSNIFFFANDGQHGSEPWKTDGTSAGTAMIKDINPGVAGSLDNSLFADVSSLNGLYCFSAITPDSGGEPWVSDGTAGGTMLLKDIFPDDSPRNYINYLIQHDGFVYFAAQRDFGENLPSELWKTAGTPASTVKLSDLGNVWDAMGHVRVFRDEVHFVVDAYVSSVLWKTDGTASGTSSYFSYGTHEGGTRFFDATPGYLIFYGNDQGFDSPLYRSDGTTAGTEPFKRFSNNGFLEGPRDMTSVNDYVFYADHDGLSDEPHHPYSQEDYFHLFQTDGVFAESMRTMFGISTVGTNNITNYNERVIFTTHDDQGETPENNPKSLWIYDPIDPPNDSATFTLVDAGSDEDLRRLTEGATIVLDEIDPQSINVRYNPLAPPGSVVFKVNDVVVRTETAPPYSLGGDINGDYAPWQRGSDFGAFKLTAIPYSGSGGTGTPGESLTVSFTIEPYGQPETDECTASGTILREYWDNVSGNNVSSIPVNSSPTSTSELTIFEGPTNVDTNYGARIRGYICPPTTGSYTFWIASNDHSELWLSTNESPANKIRIAYVTGATNPREWSKYTSQRSTAITLTAGQRYYIEALHKQGAGTDNIAVGWQLPGGAMERPIPGNRLSPFGSGENAAPLVTIEDPEHGETFTQPVDITINATASDPDGSIAKVEFFDYSTKLGEDLTAPYSFVWRNAPSGPHTLTAKATDNEGRVASSSQVRITVNSPCEPRGTIAWDLWEGVPGDRVSDVPVNSPPSRSGERTNFEWPTNFGDRFATRLRGYICPPMSGNYQFWIASNDHSELWLSTDDDPSNKVRIAWVTGATNPRQWDKYPSQVSAPIMLTSGRRYYIESLHKESIGSDHLSVGWQLPNGGLERPIDGFRLSPFGINSESMVSDDGNASVKKALANQVSIYPNPARSGDPELTLSGYEDIKETIKTDVEIINLTGEVVFREEITCGGDCGSYLMKLNKQLVPGVYLVNLKANGTRVSKRLLVK